jgi:hypothetical protein
MLVKIPLTLPSPARGEGFLIPLPRREGLGEGEEDLDASRIVSHVITLTHSLIASLT